MAHQSDKVPPRGLAKEEMAGIMAQLSESPCSTRFVWRDGMTFEGKRFRELHDREAHCDRCAPVGGYTIEADGFYPWHHKRRQETEAGARRVCEQYLARQLKGEAEALLTEAKLLLSNS